MIDNYDNNKTSLVLILLLKLLLDWKFGSSKRVKREEDKYNTNGNHNASVLILILFIQEERSNVYLEQINNYNSTVLLLSSKLNNDDDRVLFLPTRFACKKHVVCGGDNEGVLLLLLSTRLAGHDKGVLLLLLSKRTGGV